MAGSLCLELLIIQTKHRHITGNPQQKIVVISSNLFLQCVWLTSLVVHMDNCLNINFVIPHHGIKRAKSRDVRHVIQVRYFVSIAHHTVKPQSTAIGVSGRIAVLVCVHGMLILSITATYGICAHHHTHNRHSESAVNRIRVNPHQIRLFY